VKAIASSSPSAIACPMDNGRRCCRAEWY
jgi:hypothetical protein